MCFNAFHIAYDKIGLSHICNTYQYGNTSIQELSIVFGLLKSKLESIQLKFVPIATYLSACQLRTQLQLDFSME